MRYRLRKKKTSSSFIILFTLRYKNFNKKKNIEFFNEEENTDFLIFEQNNVFIDYSDNLFTFHKIEEDEKILEVDLDNQEIIESEKMEVDEENLSEEVIKAHVTR